jgi:hypothetical protein
LPHGVKLRSILGICAELGRRPRLWVFGHCEKRPLRKSLCRPLRRHRLGLRNLYRVPVPWFP